METHKPLLKDADGENVDEHMYRSMIGSLMYLTSSRPDIMFAVCVCARFQVNPKVSHLHAVKRIFRYLKGEPKLGLWYPKDSPFDLVAYTDSDYARASLDRKSITEGCQFLGCRLISWQCKKQTMVAKSTTEAEYLVASSCYVQVLWIQNQLLDYGYNFMHTKIYIDNESTICIVKNHVFHSKTKHTEIRHHFIRDSNEKKPIQMIKIHTYKNVTDLLTKAFDKGIGVNAGNSKLMLLGINLLLLEKVNAARHNLLQLVFSFTAYCGCGKESDIIETSCRRDLLLKDAEDPIANEAANEENVPTHSNDPLLSGEDSLKLKDLMEICTKLQQRVLELENTKTAQAQEISSLKVSVKRLEKKGGSRTYKLKRLFKVGRSAQVVSSEDKGLGDQEDVSEQGRKIDDIDKDAEVTLVDKTQGSTAEVSAAATITNEEITLAPALAELRSAKPKVVVQELVQSTTITAPSTIPKAKSITFRDPGESTTRTTLTPIPSNIKDKGKAKMIEPEKPLKKKEQIRLNEELAFKLQAKEEEQARLARENAEKVEEANISWDNSASNDRG
ncbi:hypothetical protein Tco_0726715 [Tanacetum coccineum]|uniref:Uncharacterized protein n=1 Tax=Tanacetum coccineum TaxID=301880 RepID=A0ABQ4YGB6_9ASTR